MRIIIPAALLLTVIPTAAHAADVSLWTEFLFYVQTKQQEFHRELASALRALQGGGMAALIAMITVSFLYGVFHAAGPGHGKAVIGTYLLTHKSALKRGITLSVLASLLQGIMAILLVEGVVLIIGISSRDAISSVPYLEKASFALVGLIGLYLIKRAVDLFRKPAAHSHGHDHEHVGHGDTCDSCGHAHGPTAEELTKKASLRDHIAIIFSIGIRPCSGSVLVLVFAEVLGLRLAGILSVLMISVGTAITVSALAIIAVYFQKAARAFASDASGDTIRKLAATANLAGGIFITFLSLSLLMQPMGSGNPLL
ncbi:high frequency lysogenization protein HflD [Sneathiella sp. P13V-1]|uniref:nickel/cobalt transporter n=1 Tax=Sneathiella sp. P13V-1 TaxID=2697366 RepID=UPI00187BA9BF|nr:nickel/cobalt transporter [Sneathiella sp. P13V-1]MBE7635891.1 high frequency lysogenization protein HflD [Sneathiella sp. P13V-1]